MALIEKEKIMSVYTNAQPSTVAESIIQHSKVFAKSAKRVKEDLQFILVPQPADIENKTESNEEARAAHLLQRVIEQARQTNEENRGRSEVYFTDKGRIEVLLQRHNLILGEPTLVAGLQINDVNCRQKTLNQRMVYLDPATICAENLTKLYLPLDIDYPAALATKEKIRPATSSAMGFKEVTIDRAYVQKLIDNGLLQPALDAELSSSTNRVAAAV